MSTQAREYSKFKRRFAAIAGLIAFAVFITIAKCIELQVTNKEYLQRQGDNRTVRAKEVPAYRGMITDRNGEPLAVSTPISSIWLNPRLFVFNHPEVPRLVQLLGMSENELAEKVEKYSDKEFVYLRRHIPPTMADDILSLDVPGVFSKDEYRRYYPHGEVNSHILGFTNIDDVGIAGLEKLYQSWLEGKSGKKIVIKDRLGREVDIVAGGVVAEPGRDLALSIDQRLQFLAYAELKKVVEKHNAVSGSVVVLDVNTGEVLAMANQPSFNPNLRNRDFDKSSMRNRALVDHFEPGSVMKTFSMVSILENQPEINGDTEVNTSPGVLKLPGGVVRDLQNNGVINLESVLKRSSNIGISRFVLDMPAERLWDTYDRLGFGYTTGSGFPGESTGVLRLPRDSEKFVLATMSFGYGVAVTPAQLAKAYATIGAGGVSRPVSFVKVTGESSGVKSISSSVSRQVLDMLTDVVSQPRSKAKVPGYYVAGKTGTARKLSKTGYESGRHRAVMAGLAPAVNPRFAIVVTVNEPRSGTYYANQVAAPVFSNIASGALRLFNIQPDLLDTQGVQVAQNGTNRS